MTKRYECAIFQDLYDLYEEEELEPDTMKWMEEHERSCGSCKNGGAEEGMVTPSEEDRAKINSIRILTGMMYGFFIVLSLWMSIWYFW